MPGLPQVSNIEQAFLNPDSSLAYGMILTKTIGETDELWKFAGIASDETEDAEGDTILRKSLDLTYASRRGYVNWDHKREPELQLGFLTKAELVSGKDIETLKKKLDVDLPKTASVYVEGTLYKYVPKAEAVYNMMKSITDPTRGPGMSLDGAMAREVTSGDVVKAFVRGVAITPIPAQPNTLCRLVKSLRDYSAGENDKHGLEQERMLKGMTFDEATLWVLKQKPEWTYDLASRVVRFTIQNKEK